MLMRALKILLTTLLALVLGLCALLALVWWRPELLLNEKRVQQALRFAPEGLSMRWSAFEWSFARDRHWLTKSTRLRLQDFCVQYGQQFEGCADDFLVELSFSLEDFRPRLTRVTEMRVIARSAVVRQQPPEQAPPPSTPLPDLRWPAFAALYPSTLPLAAIGAIEIRVGDLRLEPSAGGAPLHTSFALRKIQNAKSPLGFAFALEANATQERQQLLKLEGEGELTTAPPRLRWSGKVRAKVAPWQIESPLTIDWGDSLRLQADLNLRNGKTRIRTPLALDWNQKSLALQTGLLTLDRLLPQRRVLLDRCRLTSQLNAANGMPEENRLRCDLTLVNLRQAIFPPFHFSLDATAKLRPTSKTRFHANLGLLSIGTSPYLESNVEASAQLEIDRVKNALVGTPEPTFAAKWKIPNFSEWRRALERTPLAVPAPFRALEGPATLELQLTEAKPHQLTWEAKLQSDFRGGQGAFVTRNDAILVLENPWQGPRKLRVKANALLDEVRLHAPPLRFEEPPKFLPDSRFFRTREELNAQGVGSGASRKQAGMETQWSLKISNRKPIEIRTNLLPQPLPLALDLSLGSSAGLEGKVEILPMPLHLFRKEAQVKSVKMIFHGGSTTGELHGLIEHSTSEVLVRVLLLGSTEKPRVEFQSDPPLGRQQIVAVLLFNKSVSELSEEEASSTTSLSQATADGALGLFSLFFLSSTPIERLSYDPITQTYAARVRLGDKTSLSIGSDFDRERQVALRQRLGNRWAIRTELHEESNRPDVLLTLLEWFRRF